MSARGRRFRGWCRRSRERSAETRLPTGFRRVRRVEPLPDRLQRLGTVLTAGEPSRQVLVFYDVLNPLAEVVLFRVDVVNEVVLGHLGQARFQFPHVAVHLAAAAVEDLV